MIIDQDNGMVMDSRSITLTSGATAADLQAPPIVYVPHRLGGTRSMCVGCAVGIDDGEGEYGNTTYAALNASTTATPFGRQVIPTVGAAATNTSFRLFRGVYSGLGPPQRGFNMPAVTQVVTFTGGVPNNALTYAVSTSKVVPGTYAVPGDIVLIVKNGPVVAFVHDIVATTKGDTVSNVNASMTSTHDGTMSLSSIAGPSQAVVFDEPTAFAATGAAMGCRSYVFK